MTALTSSFAGTALQCKATRGQRQVRPGPSSGSAWCGARCSVLHASNPGGCNTQKRGALEGNAHWQQSYGIASPCLLHQASFRGCTAPGVPEVSGLKWVNRMPVLSPKPCDAAQISTVVEAAKKASPVKKATKTVKKAASRVKSQAKGATSGAAFWYGPDRPGYLGKLHIKPAPADIYPSLPASTHEMNLPPYRPYNT